MAQVSYGTITITDTNDIEEIFSLYGGSNDANTSPAYTYAAVTGGTIWKRNVTAITNYKYIWQITAITKTGIIVDSSNWQQFYGVPIRITGEEGDDARNIITVTPYYYLSSSDSSQTGGNWSTSPQAYPSTGVYYYWTKTITTYDSGSPSESTPVLDMFLTNAAKDARDANATAAIANSIAQHANENAQGAMSQSTETQYQTDLLKAKVKNFWWDSNGAHIASGVNGADVTKETISTYGYNALTALGGISFKYNDAKVVDLNSSTPSLDFYKPPTISNNGSSATAGAKTMSLTSNSLNFYGSSTSTADATLTSTGLLLSKGGIEAGDPNQSGFIYLSTEDYPLREFILTEDQAIDNNKTYYQFDSNSQTYIDVEEPDISEINTYYELTEAGIPINNYTPTKGDNNLGTISSPAWRQVIGTKFGVDSEGNLYASGANINGAITATSLTIQSNGNNYDGMAAINISGYDITIEIYNDENESDPDNYTYLIPHMYHNGENIDNTITDKTDFIWYRDDSSIGTAGAVVDGGIRAYRRSTYRVIYEFEDGAVGDSTTIQDRYLYPTEYITDITDAGIKVHPKEWLTDSNYLQIDGNGIYVKNSNDIELAHFTGTDVQIGQSSLNNVFIDEDSLDIRIGDNTLASFSANNIIIGKSGRPHSRLSSNGMFFYDETNKPVAFIANISGSPFFTFGTRKSGALISPYSFAEGEDVSASGVASHAEGSGTYAAHYAHAEGYNTQAKDYYSHAQNNGTIASQESQTVIGEFNIEDIGNTHTAIKAFIIGNGRDDSNRSNALAVNWGGDVEIAGTLTQGSDRRLKNHKTYLSIDAIDFINNLKPAYYTKDNQPHVGFYAQDVEEIDPWNCMVGEMNGYKTLGYTEIIAPLVAYCQHLEERILELENK